MTVPAGSITNVVVVAMEDETGVDVAADLSSVAARASTRMLLYLMFSVRIQESKISKRMKKERVVRTLAENCDTLPSYLYTA